MNEKDGSFNGIRAFFAVRERCLCVNKVLSFVNRLGFCVNRDFPMGNRVFFAVNHATSSFVIALTSVMIALIQRQERWIQ